MTEFARHALDHLFHNQNQKYAYHMLLVNYKAGLATVWTFLARIRLYPVIIVECFYYIKFAVNKANKTKSDAVSEIIKSAFESKDIHTTQTCEKRRLRWQQ